MSNSAIAHGSMDLANPNKDVVSGVNLRHPEWYYRRYLEALETSFSTARRITSALPKASLAKGITVSGADLSPELKRMAEQVVIDKNPVPLKGHPNLNLGKYLRQAAIAAERTGGAVVLIDVDDGGEPDEPVNLDKIKGIRGLRYFDGYDVFPDWSDIGYYSGEIEPNYYRFFNAFGEVTLGRVHASRVCPLNSSHPVGREIAYEINNGWLSDSALRVSIRSILRLETATQATTNKLIKSGVPVFQIAKMIDNLARNANSQQGFSNNAPNNYTDKTYRQRLEERLLDFAEHFSVYHVLAVDKEKEAVELKEYSFNHNKELLEHLVEEVVADSGLPSWVLRGQFVKSLGSNQEGESRAWESQVNQYRGGDLNDAIAKVLTYWMLSKENPHTKGTLPDDWSFNFIPVWEQSGEDIAKQQRQEANTLKTLQEISKIEAEIRRNGGIPTFSTSEIRNKLRETGFDGTDIPLEDDEQTPKNNTDSGLTPDGLMRLTGMDRRAIALSAAKKQKRGENHSLELETLRLTAKDSWDDSDQASAKLLTSYWEN